MYERIKRPRRGYGDDSFWTDEEAQPQQEDASNLAPADWGLTVALSPSAKPKSGSIPITPKPKPAGASDTKWLLLAGVAVLLFVTKKPRASARRGRR